MEGIQKTVSALQQYVERLEVQLEAEEQVVEHLGKAVLPDRGAAAVLAGDLALQVAELRASLRLQRGTLRQLRASISQLELDVRAGR